MYRFVFILICLLPTLCNGQDIVSLELDSSFADDKERPEIEKYVQKFDCYIYATTSSVWSRNYNALVFGRKDDKWNAWHLDVSYKGERRHEQTKFKTKRQKLKKSQEELLKVVNGFDTLNMANWEKSSIDGILALDESSDTVMIMITDANTDIIVLKNETGRYSMNSYAPWYFQPKFYMEDRYWFMCATKAFEGFFYQSVMILETSEQE
ncbi:MAG: hypothetical protein NXI10_08715 [bacterium]|nr:hypothetical protein [bacterium]